MEIQNLMIGDWVIDRVSMPDSITKVGKYDFMSVRNYELEPIQLTEEILRANGFKFYKGDDKPTHNVWINPQMDYRHRLEECPNGGYYWQTNGSFICVIHYVHELQHAFRLCDKNDLADNFKIKED